MTTSGTTGIPKCMEWTGCARLAQARHYISKLKITRDDVIIRGGQNIFPQEIEDLLVQHAKITEIAIVRMSDRQMGEKACAYVVLKPHQEFTFKEMVFF